MTNSPEDLDYYAILGISQDASIDEIKKSYKRLALKHHPDKGGNAETFKQISLAYSVLSDPEQRKQYDDDLRREKDGDTGAFDYGFEYSHPSYTNGFEMHSIFSDLMGDLWGFSDPFNDFFNFIPSDYQRYDRRPKQRKKVVYINQIYSPEQIYSGVDDVFVAKAYSTCPECNGNRFKGDLKHYCHACCVMDKTKGVVIKKRKGCKVCGGIGFDRRGVKWCKRCNKSGKVSKTIETPFRIPAGWPSNKPIMIKNAYYHKHGYMCDVGLYVLWDDSNTKFKRLGQHLEYSLHISLEESLCGVCANITTLDKRVIEVKSTPGEVIKTGDKRVVVGEGLPIDGKGKGDLIVTFIVDYPERISIEQAKAIATILNPQSSNSNNKSQKELSAEYSFSPFNPRKYPKSRVDNGYVEFDDFDDEFNEYDYDDN